MPSVFRDYHFIAANLCSGPTALIGSAPAGSPLFPATSGSSVVEKRRHHSESAEQLADSPHCSILRIPRAVNSVKPGIISCALLGMKLRIMGTVRLALHRNEDRPLIREADRMKIAQRFIAGLGNAIGHSPRSGRLKISPSPTQPSASRTRDVNAAVHPALKRWAIFNRPLRGRDGPSYRAQDFLCTACQAVCKNAENA